MSYLRLSVALAIFTLALSGCDTTEEDEAFCISECQSAGARHCGVAQQSTLATDQSSDFYDPSSWDNSCTRGDFFIQECGSQPYLDAYNSSWEDAGCSLNNAGDDDDSAN